MSTSRPYISKSIDELEALFEDYASNQSGLKRLERELDHRGSARASKLRKEVSSRLLALKAEKVRDEGRRSPARGERADEPQATVQLALPLAPPAPPPPAAEAPPRPAPHEPRVVEIRSSIPASRRGEPVEPANEPLDAAFAPCDLDDVPTFPTPAGWNEPHAILRAWTVLEVLSPQTFRAPVDLAAGDRRRVADLSSGVVPWGTGEKSRPNYQLYYEVVLGAIPMDLAMDQLLRVYGHDEERGRRERERAAIATVLVSRDGLLLDEGGVAISSFAWALPQALASKLGKLGNWPLVEPKLVEGLRAGLDRHDNEGRKRPLTLAAIANAFEWLVDQLGLDRALVERPAFAVRTYHYFKAKGPPEPSLLNSFFLADLARAEGLLHEHLGAGLRRYLGLEAAPMAVDVLNDKSALQGLVAPGTMPEGRWPAEHPLVFLQQGAVGAIRRELRSDAGVVAVNGPPGTGKTTLLRDVVAACVVDRAMALAEFKDPADAFSASGHKVAAGQGFFHIYRLDPRLKGHEIVVASSNNKAVENVSRELPGLGAVHDERGDLNYFRVISDALADKRLVDDQGDEEISRPAESTWGLVAAVLGNAANRHAFQQVFWRNDDWSFKSYLRAAKGDAVVKEIVDPKTGRVIRTRPPFVVQIAKPPTAAKAASAWRSARARFLGLVKEVRADLAALDEARDTEAGLQAALELMRSPQSAQTRTIAALQAANAAVAHADLKAGFARTALNARAEDLARQERIKPGFVERMLRASDWTAMQSLHAKLEDARLAAEHEYQAELAKLRAAQDELARATLAANALESEIATARARAASLGATLEAARARLGDRLIDDATFRRRHEEWNLVSPWLADDLQRRRSEVFAAAMALHKAFIEVNAQRVYHNLSVLMDAMAGNFASNEAKRELLGDLWSTLFLVVPVVSTTFASVGRMLGALPPEALGWLLIDEAGQATPQAAVGAVMRAKRAVVVGDPLQIPPVVSMPERLVSEICAHFKVERARWAAPDASVQTISDAISRHQAAMDGGGEARRVGLPLLVHRRCADPMFRIANEIAYGGQMVRATKRRDDDQVATVLGRSRWLDVEGRADSKWCRAEGEVVLDLFARLADAGVRDPDVFVISPFRVVAQELRLAFEREPGLCARLGVEPDAWCRDRVGTIHTFQGREANTVVLVLGAPMPGQHGARTWATSTPNILNVAVSRAKERLYVVGSYAAWSGAGHARCLAHALTIDATARP